MALMLGLAATPPANAAAAAVVVFTAGANVGAPVYAPVSPACGLALCPGANTTFSFSTANPGLGGQRVCIGVGSGGPGVSVNGTTVAPCNLASSGNFGSVAAGLGAWCGLSSGNGTSSGQIGSAAISGVGVQWVTSAGTIIPLVFTNGGLPAGVGAVQTTGASPGTCGLNPLDGFAPTTAFAVTGFAAIATA